MATNERLYKRQEFLADLMNEAAEYLHEAGIEEIWRKELDESAKAMGVTLTSEELDDMELGRLISDAHPDDFEDIPYCSGCEYHDAGVCAYDSVDDCKRFN